jgi:hypothetical protein
MGLKGYRLWAMGQLDSNVQSPTPVHRGHQLAQAAVHRAELSHQDVAAHKLTHLRKKTLEEPVYFYFTAPVKGSRV